MFFFQFRKIPRKTDFRISLSVVGSVFLKPIPNQLSGFRTSLVITQFNMVSILVGKQTWCVKRLSSKNYKTNLLHMQPRLPLPDVRTAEYDRSHPLPGNGSASTIDHSIVHGWGYGHHHYQRYQYLEWGNTLLPLTFSSVHQWSDTKHALGDLPVLRIRQHVMHFLQIKCHLHEIDL